MVKRLILVFHLIFVIKLSAQNTLISGGSIRYEHIENQSYKITATLNRACEGEALIDLPSIDVFSENNHFNLNCTRVAIQNISNYCQTTQPCNIQNNNSNPGIEQHIYEAMIDFSVAPYSIFKNPNNCKVYFSISASKRSDSITNISKGNFYVEAMLNLCLLNENEFNHAATSLFNKNIHQPLNSPFALNYDAFDLINKDSISFE